MNSPMVVDIARRLVARKESADAGDDPQRVAALYRVIFQRSPRADETELGLAFVDDLKRAIAGERELAPSAAATPVPALRRRGSPAPDTGRAPVRNQGEKVERRPPTAWEQYAQALLFGNELAYVN
jgi:hypothetical protein